jgi:hypothetical protein
MNRKRKIFTLALMPVLLFLTASQGAAGPRCDRGYVRCQEGCDGASGGSGAACRKYCDNFYKACRRTEDTQSEVSRPWDEWPIRSQGKQVTGGGLLDGGPGLDIRAPAATGTPLGGGARAPAAPPAAGPILR